MLIKPVQDHRSEVSPGKASKHRKHRLALDDILRPAKLVNDRGACVISQGVINRGHKVARMDRVVFGLPCDSIAAAVDMSAANPTPCQDRAINEWPMVPSWQLVPVDRRSTAKLARPGNQCFIQQPP